VHQPAVGRLETWVPRRRLPRHTAASSALEWGSASAGNTGPFIGAATSHCAHGLLRWARGPRPRPACSAGGGRGRTGGHRGVRPATNAGAPRGSPGFEGGLGARNAMERHGTSVGVWPNGEAGATRHGAARHRPARPCVTVPLHEHLKLQKFE
jgi:hypothetical protein